MASREHRNPMTVEQKVLSMNDENGYHRFFSQVLSDPPVDPQRHEATS